jgi:nucleoid-associated protein YejK
MERLMDKITVHKNICADLNGIYQAKNKAYGDAFGKTYQELGIISSVTRMTDKMERIKSLCRGAEQNDESLKDTLLDLANYCIMTLIEMGAKPN